MKKQTWLGMCVATMTITGIAMAALNNENRTISQLDTQQQKLIIHLTQPHSTSMPSACNAYNNMMACDLNDAYCDMAGKLAIAAFMAGRQVDFDLSSTECNGTFVKFTRFRISD